MMSSSLDSWIRSSFITHHSAHRFSRRSITSLLRLFTETCCLIDQKNLVPGKIRRQRIQGEPFGAFDFKTTRLGNTNSPGSEINLDLPQLAQAAHKKEFHRLQFDPNLFADFAAHAGFRLFTTAHEATGQAPTTTRTK